MHLTIGRLLKNAKAWALILTFLLFVLLRRKARCDFAREFKKLVTYLSNRMSTIGSYDIAKLSNGIATHVKILYSKN